jgi:hypothetical protein
MSRGRRAGTANCMAFALSVAMFLLEGESVKGKGKK